MEIRKIGVLDAGMGGLNSLGKLHRRFPNASLHYIGDCRNLPYNIHPPEWIAQKAQRLVDFLREQKVQELVIACHTISTLLPRLDTENLLVHDIISPTLKYLKASPEEGNHSLFIGTRTTIESGCYSPSYLQPKMASYLSAVELATRIESHGPDAPETLDYVTALLKKHSESISGTPKTITLFLVCTHYFLVKQQLLQQSRAIWPDSEINTVEPSSLLVDSMPSKEAGGPGAIEIFLNAAPSPSFSQRVAGIMRQVGLEKEVSYTQF